jgi:hypothetical protein
MYRTPANVPLSLMPHAYGGNNIESRKKKMVATLSNSTIKVKVGSLKKHATYIRTRDFRPVLLYVSHFEKIKACLGDHHAICVFLYPTPINI